MKPEMISRAQETIESKDHSRQLVMMKDTEQSDFLREHRSLGAVKEESLQKHIDKIMEE